MNFFRFIWNHRYDFRSILKSIYFNFHYLPFLQAIHLPILLYKPRFLDLKGHLVILGGVRCGMIRLGYPTVSLYPNAGILIENHGGTIVFHGSCNIGNNSSISIGEKGKFEVGTRLQATTTFRLTCYHSITIGDNCSFGWDCLLLDTDFHKLTKIESGYNKGYGHIKIGANNWFGNGCVLMKRTETPNYCTISARTVLSGKIDVPQYCVIGPKNEIEIKATNVWRNRDDDNIIYQ